MRTIKKRIEVGYYEIRAYDKEKKTEVQFEQSAAVGRKIELPEPFVLLDVKEIYRKTLTLTMTPEQFIDHATFEE